MNKIAALGHKEKGRSWKRRSSSRYSKAKYKTDGIIPENGRSRRQEGDRRKKKETKKTGRRSRGGLCGIHLGLRRKE